MDARLTTLLAAGLALIALAVPGLARGATVQPQVERSAPDRFPADIPGCKPRCLRGDVIPSGRVLLSRIVRLEAGEVRAPVTFMCPKRHRVQTTGFLDKLGAGIALQIPDNQLPLSRRRSLRGFAERILDPRASIARGTVYVLCRRQR